MAYKKTQKVYVTKFPVGIWDAVLRTREELLNEGVSRMALTSRTLETVKKKLSTNPLTYALNVKHISYMVSHARAIQSGREGKLHEPYISYLRERAPAVTVSAAQAKINQNLFTEPTVAARPAIAPEDALCMLLSVTNGTCTVERQDGDRVTRHVFPTQEAPVRIANMLRAWG